MIERRRRTEHYGSPQRHVGNVSEPWVYAPNPASAMRPNEFARRRAADDDDKQPGILLRDSRKGTPHQIVTERQAGRAAGRHTRKYSDERELLQEDMNQAGVPDDVAADLLKRTDEYFGELYNAAKANGMKPADLKTLFGDWKP